MYVCNNNRKLSQQMKALLHVIFLTALFLSPSIALAQNEQKESKAAKEQPAASITITLLADNEVQVQNAVPGMQLEVYSIVGVRLVSMTLDASDKIIKVNLPKGYYIFKVGSVVRKVIIK